MSTGVLERNQMSEELEQMDLQRGSLVLEGDHLLRVMDVTESDVSGPSGYTYWRFNLEVAGRNDPDLGQRIPLFLSKSPGARWKVDEFLDAVEAPTEGTVNPLDFVGKLMMGVIEHGPDKKGRQRANIKALLPISDGVAKKEAVPDEYAKDIGSPALPATAQVPHDDDFDDIPF